MSEEKPCVWTHDVNNVTSNPQSCYCNGLRNGLWEFQFADNTTATGNFVGGKPHGQWMWNLGMVDGNQRIVCPHYISGQRWKTGIVMDNHKHLGENDERTEIGQLVYDFKYKDDRNAGEKLFSIVRVFFKWHKKLREGIDIIIPMPSSKMVSTKLAMHLAERFNYKFSDALIHSDAVEVKDMDDDEKISALSGKFRIGEKIISGKNILLVDDVFDSGATCTAAAEALVHWGKANEVSVFALTKTKRTRLITEYNFLTNDNFINRNDFDDEIPF